MSSGQSAATPVPRAAHAGDGRAPWGDQSPHLRLATPDRAPGVPPTGRPPNTTPRAVDQRCRVDKPRAISAVAPRQIRQLAQASTGWLVAERSVLTTEVVVGKPAAQRCRSLG